VIKSAATPVSDETTKRRTSFAKSVDGLVHEESALDRVPGLKEQFEQAKAAQEQTQENTQETEKTRAPARQAPSHTPRPEMHLRPQRSLTRHIVDKQIDARLQAKEDAKAKEFNALLEKWRATRAKGRDRTRDRDRDRDDMSL